jgi:hypothetical protein
VGGGGGAGDFSWAGNLLSAGVHALGVAGGSTRLAAAHPATFGTYGNLPNFPASPARPVLSSGTGIAVRSLVAPILFRIAQATGSRSIPSLQRAMTMIRQMGRYLAPAAVATSLGISLTDLAVLVTQNSRRRRRHINPANTKALRRSLRRLSSFERLSGRVYRQLSHVRGTRHTSHRGRRCGRCRKSPCVC